MTMQMKTMTRALNQGYPKGKGLIWDSLEVLVAGSGTVLRVRMVLCCHSHYPGRLDSSKRRDKHHGPPTP